MEAVLAKVSMRMVFSATDPVVVRVWGKLSASVRFGWLVTVAMVVMGKLDQLQGAPPKPRLGVLATVVHRILQNMRRRCLINA